jgi:hypothetical protein
MQNAWRKFINGKDGTPVLWQRPNVPIIFWALFAVVAKFVPASPWHSIFSVGSSLALATWALMEIGWGASYFRKTLGALVLVYTILSRLLG